MFNVFVQLSLCCQQFLAAFMRNAMMKMNYKLTPTVVAINYRLSDFSLMNLKSAAKQKYQPKTDSSI